MFRVMEGRKQIRQRAEMGEKQDYLEKKCVGRVAECRDK